MQALKKNQIEEAERLYENAVQEGIFFSPLGVSYKTWSFEENMNEVIKREISEAIDKAKAQSLSASCSSLADTRTKV